MFRKSPGFKAFSERIADASRDLFSTPTRGAFLKSLSGSERIVAQQSPAVGEGSRPPSSTGPDTVSPPQSATPHVDFASYLSQASPTACDPLQGTPGPLSGGGGAVQIAPATPAVGKDDARNEMVDSLQEGFFEEVFPEGTLKGGGRTSCPLLPPPRAGAAKWLDLMLPPIIVRRGLSR